MRRDQNLLTLLKLWLLVTCVFYDCGMLSEWDHELAARVLLESYLFCYEF